MIWLAVLGCAVASFVFAGIEAGLLSINRVRLHHFARQRDSAALRLERLLRHPERVLFTALIITNLLNVCAIVLSTLELVGRYGEAGYAISVAAWLPSYIFVLQLLPKALFRRFPFRALAAVASIMRAADLLLSPVMILGGGLIDLLYPEKRKQEKRLFVARDDIRYFTSDSSQGGEMSPQERAMIHNVLDFRHVAAEELMMPLDRIPTVAAEASVNELLKVSREHRVDFVPIESADGRIEGAADIFEVLMEASAGRKNAGVYSRGLLQVAASDPVHQVIRRLRTSRTGLAIVVNQAGRAVGMVSARNLVRRMVTTPETAGGPRVG